MPQDGNDFHGLRDSSAWFSPNVIRVLRSKGRAPLFFGAPLLHRRLLWFAAQRRAAIHAGSLFAAKYQLHRGPWAGTEPAHDTWPPDTRPPRWTLLSPPSRCGLAHAFSLWCCGEVEQLAWLLAWPLARLLPVGAQLVLVGPVFGELA